MRILFVTHYTAMMGANRSMVQLIIELMEKGVRPTVLMPSKCGGASSDLGKYLHQNKIPFIEAPFKMVKHQLRWKCVLTYLYNKAIRKRALAAIDSLDFDIIHTNSSVIDVGAYIARKRGIKHIWHLREFGDLDYNFKTPFGKWFQRYIYDCNSDFIAISQEIKKHYLKYIPSSRLHLIYNGILVKSLINRYEHNDRIEFCIVGLIYHTKRQLDVLKALNIIINHHRVVNIHLTIIGEGPDEYKKILSDYISEHSLSSYVTFTGNLANISPILEKMDVGIMASSNEAFGRVTVEYMMNGLAVIASDGGANKEIIEDGVTGLIYPACDPIALADRMERLIRDNNFMKQLMGTGYHNAISKFSSKRNSDNIFALYKKVLGQ